MKKMMALLIALMMAGCVALSETESGDPIGETETVASVQVEGTVLETTAEQLLIQQKSGEQLLVLLNEETVLSTDADLQPGDYVRVTYSGKMTRSLPAQLTAQVVHCYHLIGTVEAVEEGSFLLQDGDGVTWQVLLPEDEELPLAEGMEMTVFYDGKMTRSLPAQVTALHLRAYVLGGEVTAVEEVSFTLVDEQGEEHIIHLSETTIMCTALEVGAQVRVVTNGMVALSLPDQRVALEVLPAEGMVVETTTIVD